MYHSRFESLKIKYINLLIVIVWGVKLNTYIYNLFIHEWYKFTYHYIIISVENYTMSYLDAITIRYFTVLSYYFCLWNKSIHFLKFLVNIYIVLIINKINELPLDYLIKLIFLKLFFGLIILRFYIRHC